MDEEERLRYNANYHGLTAAQALAHGELMRMHIADWPPALRAFCDNRAASVTSHDALAVAVADWLKTLGGAWEPPGRSTP